MSNLHGIRAVPSEGTRFRATSYQLSKDNYTQWSGRLKGILVVNKVWDLVSERRCCPARPRAYSRRDNDENLSPEDITAEKIAVDKFDAYEEDYNCKGAKEYKRHCFSASNAYKLMRRKE